MLPSYSQLPKTTNYRSTAIYARPGIFFEDESECPEEDECEIDWGAMPGFEDDDDDKSEEEKSNEKQEAVIEQLEEINEELDELEPQEAYVRQVERSLEKSRTIFEMNWEIENCIVDKDTCTDFCSDCAGSGKNWCKFCRGTRMISLGKDFRSCLLCSDTTDGRVDCSTCSGTGNISPWAKTHDKILKAKGSL